GAELVPVAVLRTRRSGVRVRELGGGAAEVVFDAVAVLDGEKVAQRFREVEVELLAGDPGLLERIGGVLRAAGARDGDGRPKLFKALGLEPAPLPTAAGSSFALDHVRTMLHTQLGALLAHDPGTRLGSDPEELHKMRVALRRLRATLRAARPMFAREWIEGLRAELEWLGGLLGAVRDLDVLREYFRDELATLEPPERRAGLRLLRRLEGERAAARETMLGALEDVRYLGLLDRLEEAVERPEVVEPGYPLREIAASEFKRLRNAVRRLPDAPGDAELHGVRIKGKRARYAAELAEGMVGEPAARFIEQAKLLQDALGEHQDAVVAEGRIRALVAHVRGSNAGFVAGRLVERQRTRRQAARADFARLWPKVERRGRKAWE
ncbi:MAG: CHAD domain-containing protein, partial [Candidatus Rokubacteria bacterium]|nr:CHAD domain-containing protein [Candidatus Rokubacteria bacterium]